MSGAGQSSIVIGGEVREVSLAGKDYAGPMGHCKHRKQILLQVVL